MNTRTINRLKNLKVTELKAVMTLADTKGKEAYDQAIAAGASIDEAKRIQRARKIKTLRKS